MNAGAKYKQYAPHSFASAQPNEPPREKAPEFPPRDIAFNAPSKILNQLLPSTLALLQRRPDDFRCACATSRVAVETMRSALGTDACARPWVTLMRLNRGVRVLLPARCENLRHVRARRT